MRRATLISILLLASCADRERETKTATLGDVTYAVPEGWSMRDVSQNASTILVWTPSDNARKESVTVIRTQAMPHLAQASSRDYLAATLGQTLRQPGRPVRTKLGIDAVRVDGRFTPTGAQGTYARSHVVFADGDALVHIIYTAREPDREVFDLVLDRVHVARKAG